MVRLEGSDPGVPLNKDSQGMLENLLPKVLSPLPIAPRKCAWWFQVECSAIGPKLGAKMEFNCAASALVMTHGGLQLLCIHVCCHECSVCAAHQYWRLMTVQLRAQMLCGSCHAAHARLQSRSRVDHRSAPSGIAARDTSTAAQPLVGPTPSIAHATPLSLSLGSRSQFCHQHCRCWSLCLSRILSSAEP